MLNRLFHKPAPVEGTLRSLADSANLQMGVAVDDRLLRGDPRYRELIAREFNMVTAEDAMKFERLHPEPDVYTFEDGDLITGFAQAHGVAVRGHALVWHRMNPAWIEDAVTSPEHLLKLLREHVVTVATHYRGRACAWDVVNEAVSDDGALRESVWLRGLGKEYIEKAFTWAHEADPDACLFYNDYGCEHPGPKQDAVFTLISDLKSRDVPIHGMGFQGHMNVESAPGRRKVTRTLERFATLGLRLQFTEADIWLRSDDCLKPTALKKQARLYAMLMQQGLAQGCFDGFTVWGVADHQSWVPAHFPSWGAPLLFDEDYAEKPAYDALRQALHKSSRRMAR